MPFSFFGLIKPNIKKLKANNDIEGLIEALKQRSDYTIRTEAAEALIGMDKSLGKKKLPVLYNALGDPDKEVRRNVAEAIHTIGADEEGIPYLIDSLNDESWGISTNVCRSLAALGVKAIPALTQALKHKSRVIRENAIRALGMMGSSAAQALPHLINALSASEFEVRQCVVEAMGNLGSMTKDAVPQLLEVWNKEPEIRCMVETLGKIGATEAIDPLLKQLFAVPRRNEAENFKEALLALVSDSSLLKEVVEWAVRASTYEHKGKRHGGGWYEAGYITLEDSEEAIRCLCDVNTPVVNNLLHLIAQKKDISITMDKGCSNPWEEKVSFENQRKQAVNELKKRGNPTYRPEAYYKISEVEAKEFVRQVEAAQQKEREQRYQFLLSFLKKQRTDCREDNDRATYLKELVDNYKTMEVFRLLASDLVGDCDIHSGYRIYEIVRWLIAIGQEFGGQEVRSTLSNILRHLTKELANTELISPDGLHSFETAFVELGKELSNQELISALSAIKGPWPYSYQTVIDRISEEKKS